MSRWKTGEKLIDEVESDWRKRIDNCAQFGFQINTAVPDPVLVRGLPEILGPHF